MSAPLFDSCPHCPDGHEPPERRAWAVWVDTRNVDGDGQSVQLIVAKTGGWHCSESDAEWLRQVIRDAKGRRDV